LVTTRFIARRNITRRSSCWATLSATSLASSSGLRISAMFTLTALTPSPDRPAISWRSRSMSSPFLPITIPGRAVWIVTCSARAGRSICTRLTEACDSFFSMNSRIAMSLFRKSA